MADGTDRFPCAQCGASLRFDPGAETLTCDYCGHRHHFDPHRGEQIEELDYRRAVGTQIWREETETTRVVGCDTCGAQVEFDPAVHSAECPFCASPVVTDTGEHRHFKPKGVLPFAVTEREAHQAMEKWLGSRWFAPTGLAKYARASKAMSGVYAPYWTFDAETESDYTGARGDVYYVTQYVTQMTENGPRRVARQVARIRWTSVRGRVRRFFDDVLVLGSQSLPREHADALAPWDLHALMPYRTDYLAGFRAEAYTVDLEDAFAEARAVMDLTIRRDVRFDIGGDQQRVERLDTRFGATTFKHILLPVWVAAYRYRGRAYRFVVNGRSGKVQGERPFSRWKIAVAVVFGAILLSGLAFVLHRTGALDQIFSGGAGMMLGPDGRRILVPY